MESNCEHSLFWCNQLEFKFVFSGFNLIAGHLSYAIVEIID